MPVIIAVKLEFCNKFYKNNIDVILIDHHKTGAIVAEKYPWYNLNVKYCATKLTQMYFKVDELESFADYVNVQDLQFNSHPLFSQANFIGDIAYKGYDFPYIIDEENFKCYQEKHEGICRTIEL